MPADVPDLAALAQLLDRRAVIDVSHAYAAGIDHRDWDRFADCFAEQVVIDTSSFSGHPARQVARQPWVESVRTVNGSFDATQHLMANHTVTFDNPGQARCVNEVRAAHWFSAASMDAFGLEPADACCTLVGHYDNRLARLDGRWRLTHCRLQVRYRFGDERVWALARQRGASMSGPSSREATPDR